MRPFKLPPYQRKRTQKSPLTSPTSAHSFHFVEFYSKSNMTSTKQKLPQGCAIFEHQVAGHVFQPETEDIGMLKNLKDKTVLKPAGTPKCAEREINFYETLKTSTDETIQQLKEFVPEYKGTTQMFVGKKETTFIRMNDLTFEMQEPCIIDLKMGRRTWDPLATEQKRITEDGKYVQCKQTVGFCIPGFQVYQLKNNSLKQFGKDFGKRLNEKTIRDAIRMFLNLDYGYCRQLIMQILTKLWPIQKFMRTQKMFKFYSSSILIIYDARKLRQLIDTQRNEKSVTDRELAKEQMNKSWPATPVTPDEKKICFDTKTGNTFFYKKIQRTHSHSNDYEKDMKEICDNYNLMLDNLIGLHDKTEWIQVKMIDFAHTFRHDELPEKQTPSVDKNYLEAIENLVKIFEEFLNE